MMRGYAYRKAVGLALAVIILSCGPRAFAGPPFQTDDPEPVDLHHWEGYLFSTLYHTPDGYATQGPAAEFNTGALPNLQLHLVVPLAESFPNGGPSAVGIGDIEAGVKYRFIQEGKYRPQVGTFPMLELPAGSASRGLGNGQLWMKLPIWIQKSKGPWTTYGGGGYTFNTAPGQKSYPFAGWLVQRDLNKKLTLGAEVFSQGRDTVTTKLATFFDAGGFYNFNPNFSLLFSLGHTFLGESRVEAYLGLYWTW